MHDHTHTAYFNIKISKDKHDSYSATYKVIGKNQEYSSRGYGTEAAAIIGLFKEFGAELAVNYTYQQGIND